MDHQDRLLERVEALERQTEMLTQYTRTVERLLRWWRGTACGLVMLNLLSLALSSGKAADTQPRGMAERMATVEKKLAAMDFDEAANEVVISGANLRIVNGLGDTRTTNGLGNLIVGYNETRGAPNVETGSHNIIVGFQHNFTSFGGLVAGAANDITGAFASVTGGSFNIASGNGSLVCGGLNNTASGVESVICGGQLNTATGIRSSISGGSHNTTSGFFSSVSGGQNNTASGEGSSVSGGISITQDTDLSWAAGSFGGEISGSFRSP